MTSPRAELRRFIADTFFVDDFKDSDSFLKNRVIDSTGMMELVAFLELRLGAPLRDGELVPENLDSIDNLVRFWERKHAPGA